ncbi:MAG: hypothetical protein ABJB70_04235 [Candidatus Udaeobacter sp.]
MKVKGFSMGVLLLVFLGARTVNAHREDYIDETLVFQTVEKGTIEPEYWFDYGYRGDSDTYFQRHNLALEYGITDRLMVDGRVTIDHPENRNTNFDSGRFETRYRFGEEGTWPIDVALSGEANIHRLADGHYQYGVEPRLILSKDFSKLNVTLNVAEELPVNRSAPSVQLASGARYDMTQLFRFGSELKYDVHERSGSVIPQIWFAFPHEITFKIGFSAGFDRNRENFARFVIEVEF